MLWVDIKYAGLIGHLVSNYKVKNNDRFLANFSCPLCGDGERKARTRGYLYVNKNGLGLNYKCHNCGAGMRLDGLLRRLDEALRQEYVAERYRERQDWNTNGRVPDEVPLPPSPDDDHADLGVLLRRVSELDEGHMAVRYLECRHIPDRHWPNLYYIEESVELNHYGVEIGDDTPKDRHTHT